MFDSEINCRRGGLEQLALAWPTLDDDKGAQEWRFPITLFDLTGRVAVVTGGNGGIGLGMATGLAAAGAAVVVAARNAEKGEAAVAALTASGARSVFVALDVADEGSCRGMIEETDSALWPARHPDQ